MGGNFTAPVISLSRNSPPGPGGGRAAAGGGGGGGRRSKPSHLAMALAIASLGFLEIANRKTGEWTDTFMRPEVRCNLSVSINLASLRHHKNKLNLFFQNGTLLVGKSFPHPVENKKPTTRGPQVPYNWNRFLNDVQYLIVNKKV